MNALIKAAERGPKPEKRSTTNLLAMPISGPGEAPVPRILAVDKLGVNLAGPNGQPLPLERTKNYIHIQ